MTKEFHFRWQWDIQSTPEQIWPLASDTNRFNRDTWQPEIEMIDNVMGTKHARMKLPIFKVEWEEEPFEWTYPYSYGIVRRYSKGPVDEMRVQVDFEPRADGGTRATYQSWFKVSNPLIQLGTPFGIGVVAKYLFERAFRKYDQIASNRKQIIFEPSRRHGLSSGGQARFKSQSEALIQQGTDLALMNRLEEFLNQADELSLQRIRPYALA